MTGGGVSAPSPESPDNQQEKDNLIIHETTITVKSGAEKAAAIAAGFDHITEIPPGTYGTQQVTWWECAGEVDAIEIDEEQRFA